MNEFLTTLKLMKSQYLIFFKILLVDIVFLGSIYIIERLASFILPSDPSFLIQIINNYGFVALFVIFFVILYISVIVGIYSFFKYLNLAFFHSLTKKTEFSLKQYSKFYKLNLLLCMIILGIFIGLNLILFLISNETFAYVFSIITFFPFILLIISLFNVSHAIFSKDRTNKEIIKKTFEVIFSKPKYLLSLLWAGLFFLGYIILYYLFAYLFSFIQTEAAIPIFAFVFTIITGIVIYLIFSFARIYFMRLVLLEK